MKKIFIVTAIIFLGVLAADKAGAQSLSTDKNSTNNNSTSPENVEGQVKGETTIIHLSDKKNITEGEKVENTGNEASQKQDEIHLSTGKNGDAIKNRESEIKPEKQ